MTRSSCILLFTQSDVILRSAVRALLSDVLPHASEQPVVTRDWLRADASPPDAEEAFRPHTVPAHLTPFVAAKAPDAAIAAHPHFSFGSVVNDGSLDKSERV